MFKGKNRVKTTRNPFRVKGFYVTIVKPLSTQRGKKVKENISYSPYFFFSLTEKPKKSQLHAYTSRGEEKNRFDEVDRKNQLGHFKSGKETFS